MTQQEFIEKTEALQKQEQLEKLNYDERCHKACAEHRERMNKEQDTHTATMMKLKTDYYATLEAIRAKRNALRIEWAESEEQRRIAENKQ